MKMDKNEKVQSLQLFTNVVTDLIRYHLLDKDNSFDMEEFLKKFDIKIIRDSFFDIWEAYKKDKRRFRYLINGRETISEKFFNGYLHYSYTDGQLSFIEMIKNYILELNRIFYIIHPKTHKKYYFSSDENVQNFLIKYEKEINGSKINKIMDKFLMEYIYEIHPDILLKYDILNKEGKYKKDYQDIINSLIKRYIIKSRTSVYNLVLDNKKEEIISLLDNKYLIKNKPFCRSISEILNLSVNYKIKCSIELNTIYFDADLETVFSDSVKNIYSKHLLLPPSIFEMDNGVYNFIFNIFYNSDSKISKVDKGLISKNINKVIRHLTLPMSFRDNEVIIPWMNNGNIELKLQEISEYNDISKYIFGFEKYKELLSSVNDLEDLEYCKLLALYMKAFISTMKMNMIPERSKLLFLICVLNHNNIFSKSKEKILDFYKEFYHIIDENIHLKTDEDFNSLTNSITLKNRIKGTFTNLDVCIEENKVEELNKETNNKDIEEENHTEDETSDVKKDLYISESIEHLVTDESKNNKSKKSIFRKFYDKFFSRN